VCSVDYWQFRVLAIIIVIVGCISSTFYFLTVREVYLSEEAKRLEKEY